MDVDKEQQLAGYFQIRSVPTVMLLKGGQIVDGFPGALPEGSLREFLKSHGITPNAPEPEAVEIEALPPDPETEVVRLRHAVAEAPGDEALKLDLVVAGTQAAVHCSGRSKRHSSQVSTHSAVRGTAMKAVRPDQPSLF